MQSTTDDAHAYTRKFYHADGLGQLELTLKDERIGRSRDRRWKFGEKKEAHGTLTVPIIELAEQGQRIVGVIEAREESIYERRGIRELDNPAWRPGDEDKRPLYVELTLDDAGQRSAVARDAWEWLIGKMAAATGETTEETQKGETGSAQKGAALNRLAAAITGSVKRFNRAHFKLDIEGRPPRVAGLVNTVFLSVMKDVPDILDGLPILRTEDGGYYCLEHTGWEESFIELPMDWEVICDCYVSPEGHEGVERYDLITMRCQETGRKSCLIDLRLSDDTPSVVELFTQLTVALRKKFPNAQLTDVIAANHPYIGGGIHSGIADKTDAAQTPSQVLRDFWAENGDELRRLKAKMAADNEALRANRENITTPSETDTANDSEVARMLEAVRGWPDAKKRGILRRDYVTGYSIDESTLTRWRDKLRKDGHDVPDF